MYALMYIIIGFVVQLPVVMLYTTLLCDITNLIKFTAVTKSNLEKNPEQRDMMQYVPCFCRLINSLLRKVDLFNENGAWVPAISWAMQQHALQTWLIHAKPQIILLYITMIVFCSTPS